MFQPNLFESKAAEADIGNVVLHALGDFQARGRRLSGRRLPLDRLRGAFDRACHRFGLVEMTDSEVAECLTKMGAEVVALEDFTAKRPFRVTAGDALAMRSLEFYKSLNRED